MSSKSQHFPSLIRLILSPFLKLLYRKYAKEIQSYTFLDLEIEIFPGVFPPRFFYSTKALLKYLVKQDLKNHTFLELGAGSGLISLYAAKIGAIVTASDISKTAVKNVMHNADKHKLKINVIHSDLFMNIKKQQFDWIIINPPFYSKTPEQETDFAWYCGENFEFFQSLFSNISEYIHETSKVLLALSDTTSIANIIKIAGENKLIATIVYSQRHILENIYIFQINKF